MKRDRIQYNWKQISGHAREQWGKLADDDLDVVASRVRAPTMGTAQERPKKSSSTLRVAWSVPPVRWLCAAHELDQDAGTIDSSSAGARGVRSTYRYDPAFADHERRYGQLREANAQLVSTALRAQELQAAAEKMQLRQTQVIALVAHELRNPLNPLRTAAVLLGRVGPHEVPRLQAIIERQVQRVSRLASDLLDVSRISTGKLRLEVQQLDLASVIDEAVEACRPAMDLRLQQLRVQLPACALRINGDPTRLAQVFGNLLDNASKYTADGGEIVLSVNVAGDAVVVTVSDNGIGMTAAAVADVFDAFVQEPHAVNFNGVGLGLGLTVVRELTHAHGGSVFASSEGPGRGSKFVVTLPLAATSDDQPK